MQINRMFQIIYILLDKKTMTARELSERFEVSRRTIYRDIETLSAAGIPVYMTQGKGGGISLLDGFVLNKAVLTAEEKSSILSSLQAVGAINFTESNSALQKLGSLFGENNTDWLEIDFSSWSNAETEAKTFHDIRSAIISSKIICFTYASGRGEQTTRQVQPLKLCFKGIARYLYAYCNLRQDFRFFKLSRIKDCVITEECFERKAIGQIFKTETIFHEEYVTLKLKLSDNMAYRVYDEFDNYIKDAHGSFIVQVVYPMGDWLFPYLFSFGSSCEILEPLEIRNAFINELQKMLDNHL